MAGIWDDPKPIEDKTDAVMFTIGLMRRLADFSYEGHSGWAILMNAADILEQELDDEEGG